MHARGKNTCFIAHVVLYVYVYKMYAPIYHSALCIYTRRKVVIRGLSDFYSVSRFSFRHLFHGVDAADRGRLRIIKVYTAPAHMPALPVACGRDTIT